MHVQEIMTEDPITLEETAKVGEALRILQTLEIRHLPIVNSQGLLVGMISDRDIRNAAMPYTISDGGRGSLEAPVSSIMSSDVVAVGPEAELREVIDQMLDNKVGALPVVEEASGDLLGIVSYVDILRELRDRAD